MTNLMSFSPMCPEAFEGDRTDGLRLHKFPLRARARVFRLDAEKVRQARQGRRAGKPDRAARGAGGARPGKAAGRAVAPGSRAVRHYTREATCGCLSNHAISRRLVAAHGVPLATTSPIAAKSRGTRRVRYPLNGKLPALGGGAL
jgi:hypothetical protein